MKIAASMQTARENGRTLQGKRSEGLYSQGGKREVLEEEKIYLIRKQGKGLRPFYGSGYARQRTREFIAGL